MILALAQAWLDDAAIAMTEGDLPKTLKCLGFALALLQREAHAHGKDPGFRQPASQTARQAATGTGWDDVPF